MADNSLPTSLSCFYGAFPGQTYCSNFTFGGEDPLKIFNSDVINPSVEHLYLKNVTGYMNLNTFQLVPNLVTLIITSSFIRYIYPAAFEKTPKLKTFSIVNNTNFPEIREELFNYCKNLNSLEINANINTNIKTGAFRNLNKLTALTLKDQPLPYFAKNFFDGLSELNSLNVHGCNLTNIDLEALYNLQLLEYISFSDNDLRELDPEIFNYNHSIKSLSLYNNPFQTLLIDDFKYLTSLEELSVPFKFILKWDKRALIKTLPNLKKILLSATDSEKHEVFDNLSKELEANKIAIEQFSLHVDLPEENANAADRVIYK